MSNNFEIILSIFIVSQLIIIPVIGLLFLGIHNERKATERLLRDAVKSLNMIAVSRGRHLR